MKVIDFVNDKEFIKNINENGYVDRHIIFVFKNKISARGLIDSMSKQGLHAGFDLCVYDDYYINIKDGGIIENEKYSLLVKTGTKWSCPSQFGNHLKVAPRSGLSFKTPIRLSNAVGTVEASYRDDIGVLIDLIPLLSINKYMSDNNSLKYTSGATGVFEMSKTSITITNGFKIAQAIPVTDRTYPIIGCISEDIYEDFDKLVPSIRGTSGYGSTDK